MLHFELLQEDRLEQGVMFADGSVSQPPENDSIFVQKPVFLWSCSIVMLSVRWDMCRPIIFVFLCYCNFWVSLCAIIWLICGSVAFPEQISKIHEDCLSFYAHTSLR